MELQEGIYDIAEGYRAFTIEKGTKVQIVKRQREPVTEPRCRDCKHCLRGKYKFSPRQWWESTYCEKKPKTVGTLPYFYHVPELGKICDLFEPKES